MEMTCRTLISERDSGTLPHTDSLSSCTPIRYRVVVLTSRGQDESRFSVSVLRFPSLRVRFIKHLSMAEQPDKHEVGNWLGTDFSAGNSSRYLKGAIRNASPP